MHTASFMMILIFLVNVVLFIARSARKVVESDSDSEDRSMATAGAVRKGPLKKSNFVLRRINPKRKCKTGIIKNYRSTYNRRQNC